MNKALPNREVYYSTNTAPCDYDLYHGRVLFKGFESQPQPLTKISGKGLKSLIEDYFTIACNSYYGLHLEPDQLQKGKAIVSKAVSGKPYDAREIESTDLMDFIAYMFERMYSRDWQSHSREVHLIEVDGKLRFLECFFNKTDRNIYYNGYW
jgi:hypothetical protein